MVAVNRKAFMPTVEAIKDKYYQIGHPGEQWQRQQLRWGWVDGGGRGNGEFACAPAPRRPNHPTTSCRAAPAAGAQAPGIGPASVAAFERGTAQHNAAGACRVGGEVQGGRRPQAVRMTDKVGIGRLQPRCRR